MNDLIIAWQDSETRTWLPVGRLSYANGEYYFVYTEGAKVSPNFMPFGWMQKLDSIYVSTEIFPLFANRILSKSRPEYEDYIRWLGLTNGSVTALDVLARTGGMRATDTLEIFPCPTPDDTGHYTGYFFSHGLRYLLPENVQRISRLVQGAPLLLALDIQNPFDASAILLRTVDPVCMVGYCPRYLASEFCELISKIGQQQVKVTVQQVNKDAPNEFRLLCKIVSAWPKNFAPCTKGNFKPLKDVERAINAREKRETKAQALR